MLYYVYVYLRKDRYTPYYVGKGKGDRCYSKDRTIPPPDPTRIVKVKENLTEEESFELEKTLIKFWGRIDNGTGVLRNLTDGGEGCSGRELGEDTKERIRDSNIKTQGRKVICIETGEIWNSSKDCKRKLRIGSNYLAQVLDGRKESWRGFTFKWLDTLSKEEIQSLSQNQSQTTPIKQDKKRVLCVDTGKVWNSVRECGDDLNTKWTNISRVCNPNLPQHKRYKGMLFVYV